MARSEADRIRAGGDRLLHGLPDPPSGISCKLGAVAYIEAIDRLQEAMKTLLDQVRIGDPSVSELLGDVCDEPHVGEGQFVSDFDLAAVDRTEGCLARGFERDLEYRPSRSFAADLFSSFGPP